MRFVIVDPSSAKVKKVEAEKLHDVYPLVNLKPGEVDFATLYLDKEGWGVSIIVYELGLFMPVEVARYFSIGNSLFVGGAVLFQFDAEGDTIDFDLQPPPVMFYRDHYEVEYAIQKGDIRRPITSINGEEVWRWPDARK
jgi:hypothetical protein